MEIPLAPGARVLLQKTILPELSEVSQTSNKTGETPLYNIVDRERASTVGLLTGLYLLALLLAGYREGLQSFALIGLVGFTVGNVVLSGSFAGGSPFLLTLAVCVLFLFAATFVFWRRAPGGQVVFHATLDCLLVGGLLLTAASWIAPLQGYLNESMGYFALNTPEVPPLDIYMGSVLLIMTGILFHLIHNSTRELTAEIEGIADGKACFRTALNCVRYTLASLNTAMVLLFLGLALPSLFLWQDQSFDKLINLESVASYAIAFLTVLLTLALAAPITAWTAAQVFFPKASSQKE